MLLEISHKLWEIRKSSVVIAVPSDKYKCTIHATGMVPLSVNLSLQPLVYALLLVPVVPFEDFRHIE